MFTLLRLEVIVILLFISSLAYGGEMKAEASSDIKEVSLVTLISKPQDYHNSIIAFKAVYFDDGDKPRFFLDSFSLENLIVSNSFPLDDARVPRLPEVDGRVVYVIALFELIHEHTDPSGVISNVREISRFGEVIWKPSDKEN
jgi:hypothetical protein